MNCSSQHPNIRPFLEILLKCLTIARPSSVPLRCIFLSYNSRVFLMNLKAIPLKYNPQEIRTSVSQSL